MFDDEAVVEDDDATELVVTTAVVDPEDEAPAEVVTIELDADVDIDSLVDIDELALADVEDDDEALPVDEVVVPDAGATVSSARSQYASPVIACG